MARKLIAVVIFTNSKKKEVFFSYPFKNIKNEM